MAKPLIELKDYNENVTNSWNYSVNEAKTYLACPDCGKELWMKIGYIYAKPEEGHHYPPQKPLHCKDCGWEGSSY